MRTRQKSFWIPLVGSLSLLLLVVLAILAASSTLSFAETVPRSPAAVEGTDSWTWRGPSHDTASGLAPHGKKIVIDPANPAIVYVATNQGVYRSANGGVTWEPRNEGLGGYGDLVVSDLELDPSNSQRLIIGTWGYGLLESTDAGLHWSRLTDPLASPDMPASASLDSEPPPVRVGGADISKPVDLPELLKKSLPSDLMLSQPGTGAGDQGEVPRALPNPMPWTPVRRVAIHPTNPNQLFACIDNDYGLYVSNNGGSSWSHVSLGTGSARTYTFAPTNSLIRYASFGSWTTSGGFYRTTNGGASWDDVGTGYIAGTVTAVAIHPTNSNIVLAATSDDGLYRSTNGGDAWTQVSSALPDVDFYSVAFAPSDPTIAYAGGFNWVYRSDDTGASWANADASFPALYVQGLAIHPTSPSTVLVGANYVIWGGVYRRTVDGNPFVMSATGMTDTFVLDIEQDPNDADTLYAATWGGGAFRSEDGGLTWVATLPYAYVYTLEATQGPTGTILYAGTFYNTYGVLKSWDRGNNWKEISKYYSSDISFDIKSLDGGPDNLVAATGYGVEYSSDGGVTWNNSSGLDQGVVLKLAQSPLDPTRLLAATYGGGVWNSTSSGVGWAEASLGLGSQYVYDVAYAPWDLNTAYAATLGVYRTGNGGASWYPSGLTQHLRPGPGYPGGAGVRRLCRHPQPGGIHGAPANQLVVRPERGPGRASHPLHFRPGL
ncbi:MAG: hypothetical protein GWN58_11930 [Anaerolineae bacterium]|nr:hypothetical protein [Anaerolineae bacterium]